MTAQKICEIDGCGKPVCKRRMCNAHYLRWYKTGDPLGGGTAKIRFDLNRKCGCAGCDETAIKNGLCARHYDKRRRHGDASAGRDRKYVSREISWAWLRENAAHIGGDCLIWPFGKSSQGYGLVPPECGNGNPLGAHRQMCILAHGAPSAAGLMATHRCGNGHLGCVNPNHLRWGTGVDNMQDAIAHGTTGRGDKNGNSKITEAQARAILAEPIRRGGARILAERYGITVDTVRKIQNKVLWPWL